MGVRVEGEGPVRTVVLDRPEVSNAVDRDSGDPFRLINPWSGP